jgi:hypothetical protein
MPHVLIYLLYLIYLDKLRPMVPEVIGRFLRQDHRRGRKRKIGRRKCILQLTIINHVKKGI